ncbi:hypothetical protein JCM1840_007192, partial [Sporobolomyces johnsonii]
SDRAWLCMNEVLFGAPLPAGMASLLALRLPTRVLAKVMLTAHRYVAVDALADGLVDEVVEVAEKGEDGSEATVRRAEEVARERAGFAESGVLHLMKRTLYASTLAQLAIDEPPNLFESVQGEREERVRQLVAAEVTAKL